MANRVMRSGSRCICSSVCPLISSVNSSMDFATAWSTPITRHVQIPDGLFAELKSRLSPTELVELVASTAAYNMVARFLVALDVTPET